MNLFNFVSFFLFSLFSPFSNFSSLFSSLLSLSLSLFPREKERLVRLTGLKASQVSRWFLIARNKRWNRQLIVSFKDGTVFDVAKEEPDEGEGNQAPAPTSENASALLPALRTAVAKLTPQSPEADDDDDDDDNDDNGDNGE